MKNLLIACLLVLAPLPAAAALIQFDLAKRTTASTTFDGVAGAALDGLSLGSVTIGGVTATLQVVPSTYTGPSGRVYDVVMNQASSRFGLNVVDLENGDGCADEQSEQFDGNCGFKEQVFVSFDQDVILESIDVSLFGNDLAKIEFEDGTAGVDITATGNTSVGVGVGGIGRRWSMAFDMGNGFSFDRFTIRTVAEPSSLALIGLALLVLGAGTRRR